MKKGKWEGEILRGYLRDEKIHQGKLCEALGISRQGFSYHLGKEILDHEFKMKLRENGIKKPREKTENKRLVPIHETVEKILGLMDKETEFVFQNLPKRHDRKVSWSACRTVLQRWVKDSGIEKHITWHCARHTFGTLAEGDDRTVAQLLGHRGTRQVATYRRTKDAKLRESVNSIKPVHLTKSLS